MAEVAGTLCSLDSFGRSAPPEKVYLILKRPNGSWDLPKGMVRGNETTRRAAVRETEEETGVTPFLTGRSKTLEAGGDTFTIYAAEFPGRANVDLSKEHVAFDWVTAEKAVSLLYPPLAKIVGTMTGNGGSHRPGRKQESRMESPEIPFWNDDLPLFEEREVNPDGTTACGVFIPLPYNLAKDFPGKRQYDDSPPHLTVLYMGDLGPSAYKVFVNLVRKFARKLKAFECDLSHYGEFLNPKGQKIACMVPSMSSSMKLGVLHALLRQYIEAFGAEIGQPVKHTYGTNDTPGVPYQIKYKPHATLAYLPPEMPYKKAKPTGSWRVNEIECWGHETVRIPFGHTKSEQPIGITRDPLLLNYPSAVPDAVRSLDPNVGTLARRTSVKEDKIPGGLADKSKPSDFDPKQLAMGIRVELEHTKDTSLAREIAMDHLKENPNYYTALKKMEKQFEDKADKIDKFVHPLALKTRQWSREDDKAGHDDAADYWRGWAAGSFLTAASNPSRKGKRNKKVEEAATSLGGGGALYHSPTGSGPSLGDIGLEGSLPVLELAKGREARLRRAKLAGLK